MWGERGLEFLVHTVGPERGKRVREYLRAAVSWIGFVDDVYGIDTMASVPSGPMSSSMRSTTSCALPRKPLVGRYAACMRTLSPLAMPISDHSETRRGASYARNRSIQIL